LSKEIFMVRALVLSVVLAFVGLFALLNWSTFAATTPLSLGFTTVNAPLGLLMLGVLVFVAVLFTVWAVALQVSVLRETRRHTKELTAQRELADRAEASRFTELRSFLSAEQLRVTQVSEEMRAGIIARLDRMDEEMRRALQRNGNSTSAFIGEIEDRLEHGRPLPPELSRPVAAPRR
jgi:membrane protein involved in colicin uptake